MIGPIGGTRKAAPQTPWNTHQKFPHFKLELIIQTWIKDINNSFNPDLFQIFLWAMEDILIVTTGGTIDKVYFDAKSRYEVGPPNIERVLSELKLSITYRIQQLMRKDSLDMTEEDKKDIRDTVIQAPETRILITHGTDTMVETGKYLADVKQKTIVLTGALEPALFKTSDALFNIGCGLGAVQSSPPGVYIAMNGHIFDCMKVRKNVAENRFEPLGDLA